MSSSGQRIDSQAFEWRLDGAVTGRGREVWITAPKSGRHEVRVAVADGRRKSEAKAEFTSYDAEREA